MKKLLGILVMGLFLTSCESTTIIETSSLLEFEARARANGYIYTAQAHSPQFITAKGLFDRVQKGSGGGASRGSQQQANQTAMEFCAYSNCILSQMGYTITPLAQRIIDEKKKIAEEKRIAKKKGIAEEKRIAEEKKKAAEEKKKAKKEPTQTQQVAAKTDDIRDFEIEEMSIGDSLLDYFSKKEISEMKNYIYPDKKFEGVKLKHREFDNYDRVQVVFKHKDKDFIIHSISGDKDYINKTSKCEKTKVIISNQILNLFDVKPDIREHKNRKIDTDPSGKSTFNETEFRITDLERINIRCTYMSQTMIDRHHFDALNVSIFSREFTNYWNEKNKAENVDEREIDLIRLGPYALGDNLLDFFSEGEINYAVSRSSSHKDSKKIKAGLFKSKAKPYDSFEIVYQQVNNKKVIVMIAAKAKFIDMETCLNTRKDLQDEFFGEKELINIKKNEEEGYNAIFAQLRDGGGIGFSCAKRGQKKYDLILRIFSVDFPSLAK